MGITFSNVEPGGIASKFVANADRNLNFKGCEEIAPHLQSFMAFATSKREESSYPFKV